MLRTTIILGVLMLLALAGCSPGAATPDPAAVEQAVQSTLTALAPRETATQPPPAATPTAESALELPPAGEYQPALDVVSVRGDPNAPVTIVEFSDFK